MSNTALETGSGADFIDNVRQQWAHLFPTVDTEPMAIVGRINRINHLRASGGRGETQRAKARQGH